MNGKGGDPAKATRRRLGWIGALAAVAGLAVLGFARFDHWRLERALLREYPDRITDDRELVSFAVSLGRPAYAENCASCHGAAMEGNQAIGAPNLADSVWLYDFGGISDIERTILYGVRSGHGKTHNVTDMPGFGVRKLLTPQQVGDVVAYTLSLANGGDGDAEAIARGSRLFFGDGLCFDCHSPDGAGNPDYGAPNLIDAEWLFGGDPENVYRSTYDGRHGLCPAWIGRLDFATIRGLAVYLHQVSHAGTDTAAGSAAETISASSTEGGG